MAAASPNGNGNDGDSVRRPTVLAPVHEDGEGDAEQASMAMPHRKTASSKQVGRSTFLQDTVDSKATVFHGTTGLLYKLGARIRNWKLRWWFLDADLRQLRYYRPPTNTEMKGVIYLDTVTAIHTSDSFGKGSGHYLHLITPRRVWVLRAASADELAVWHRALSTVVSTAGQGAHQSTTSVSLA